MKQTRQGLLRTPVKDIVGGKNKNSDTDAYECPKKQRDVFVQNYFTEDTVCTYQTGNFPVCSRRGRKYIVVMCKIDRSSMMVDTIKNIMEGEIMRMYQKLI